jgi:hypothetical protein
MEEEKMPCPKHDDQLEGRSDLECEECYEADKAEEAYWRELYEGEKLAGLLPAEHYEAEDRRLDRLQAEAATRAHSSEADGGSETK